MEIYDQERYNRGRNIQTEWKKNEVTKLSTDRMNRLYLQYIR